MGFIESGKAKEAIVALSTALDLSPEHPSAGDLFYNRGRMHKKIGQIDAGVASCCRWPAVQSSCLS